MVVLQRKKRTRNAWLCEGLDHLEFRAGIYVTISSIVWIPAEGIIDVFKELVGRGGAILDLIGMMG